jgi:hypothetical protein
VVQLYLPTIRGTGVYPTPFGMLLPNVCSLFRTNPEFG